MRGDDADLEAAWQQKQREYDDTPEVEATATSVDATSFTPVVSLSRFASVSNTQPTAATMMWGELAEELRHPKRGRCTLETCGTGEHAYYVDGVYKGCREKYVGAWSPAVYKPGTTRAADNVQELSLLVVDADHLDDAGLAQALARVESYRCLAHASHSDCPEDRSVRIVIALSRNVTHDEWPRFWRGAMTQLGMPADGKCVNRDRLYFDPCRPSDADYLFVEHDGAPLDVDEVLRNAPEPVAPAPKPSKPTTSPSGDSVYEALEALDQGYVLDCISGTSLVGGQRIELGRPNRKGNRAIVIDGKATSGFIDAAGRIAHKSTNTSTLGHDGGPLASTWCRFYGHDDATIRKLLIEHVPELARFEEERRKRASRRQEPRLTARGDGPTDGYRREDGAAYGMPGTTVIEPMTEIAPVPAKPTWHRCRDLVDEILHRATEPWIDLAVGGDPLVTVRIGGIVLLIGGTGRGKTSLAVTMLVEHAQGTGPAISCSIELPGDEWTARAIGGRCDASWSGVLRGQVPRDRMLQVLPERLAVLDRENASIEALVETIEAMRREYPSEPILVAVDYVQLVGADSEDEIRPRIGKVMRRLDKLARDGRVVLIALSQGSRASSRALSSGEKIGAETTDSGAESADLERWATATLAIGAHGPEGEDGSCAADISIGKSRMGGGDRIVPARYNGRSGLWRLTGDARPAAEVRAERESQRDGAKVTAARLAMAAYAERSATPVSRGELRKAAHVRGTVADIAIAGLMADGDLVEVHIQRRGMKRGEWPLWTPKKAAPMQQPEGDEP